MRTEDGYIIHKCLNGDSAAFGLLVDKYRESIYALAYSKLRNFHDAEDITQEVFLKAYQKLHTLKCWDSFLAWLYAITSNLCKNFIRAKFNRPDREFIAEQDSKFFDYLSLNFYQEEQAHEALYEALALLPENYRQVLTLYYLGGMSSREIAKFLGTSTNTIEQRLSRARAKLKKEMLDMMSKTYDQHKLQLGFTFRIVEMIKHIKIQPAPRSTPWLPFGLSAATGIVLTVLMFSSHLLSLTPLGSLLGSPLPGETKVMEDGELPVDVLEISEITFLSSGQGDGNDGAKKLPNRQNAFAPPLAPSSKGKWTKKADMPTARGIFSASVVNGKIYAIGGTQNLVGPISTVEEYDPAADKWTKKADMPTARQSFSTSVVDGKIYAIGGWSGPFHTTVEEYDPATDRWTKKADMPTARSELSTSVVNGKIYAIGGGRPGGLSTVEEYNPATDKWTKKADMPTARASLSTSVVNGKIYAIGGSVTAVWPGPGPDFSTVEEYDPATDKWTKKTDMPTARFSFSTSVVNGKIYAIGGMRDQIPPFSTVEEYDSVADKWAKKADMPTARVGLSTSTVNGKIYAIGGITAGFVATSTVEEYDPGFAGQGIDMEGKLPATWGRMKAGK
ncbi:sigma-70 family RNA polymerase sigma factor [Candidatus Poribacteria bacterium]|nr:sigma-70 family RNA polymerase sigma factor [Candidatus Poribacteria bacterium]